MTRWQTYPEVADAISAKPATRRAAELIAPDARRAAPVDTGKLAASIHVEDGAGDSSLVVANPRGDDGRAYAVYPELGTRYQAAQPYLRPAAYRTRAL